MSILQTGSNGAQVVALQKALNLFLAKNGSPAIKEDGDFGTNTKNAILLFQTKNGLVANGIADDTTQAKLQAAVAAPVTPAQPAAPSAGDSSTRFSKITTVVINQLEGGYYHPDMNSPTGRLKKHIPALDSSGETMFGIDRLNGKGDLGGNPGWNEFWGIIDAADARHNWGYNFTGGTSKDRLTALAVSIMAPQFEKLCTRYLLTNRNYVMSNNRLIFHFAYATWNGAGWFKKFAGDIDKAVLAGKKSPDQLADVAIWSRTQEGLQPGSAPNGLLVQTGNKIKEIFKTLG